ncbi:type II secretion system F family protein [Tessaracoccus oleiagri]|uniref:Tight adherence protein B n=1 Tax=Tessaracoccus oleiagri TaxID=686624 RepID=A0A1G9JVE3_9ACTN|nr:type II secretion system F family protein [Tessaracoccus oleiagri]SDL41124.1 tight adherence protein B [Tessaracoccus oleiagri]
MGAVMTWAAGNMLTIAGISGAIAFIIILLLLLRPDIRQVPLSRRRPFENESRTAVTVAAERLTSVIDKVAARRGHSLAERLDIAGVKTPLAHVVILTFSAMIVMVALSLLMGSPMFAVLSVPAIPALLTVWISLRISKRRANFALQLDETAQMLAGSLRSGYSFPQAMLTVGKEASSPTSDEFIRMSNELRVGRPLSDAMEHTARRMESEDFAWIGQAVAINREVGGNLADVLDNVAHTIRQRAQLRRQVASLSAEGKLSAIVLVALPFVMIAMLSLINPTYMGTLFTHPVGWVMIATGAGLLIAGTFWLRKTVEIKF